MEVLEDDKKEAAVIREVYYDLFTTVYELCP